MSDYRKPKLLLALSELFTLVDPKDEYLHMEFARIAENCGFDGVFVSEHVVMGPEACVEGLPDNPRAFVLPHMQDPATPWPHPLIKLAAIAGATKNIRVMSCALLAPLRNPIHLAKQLATLDLISEGRLTVLPTVSWHKQEYDALGIPWKERGRRLDEHLKIWDLLWSETPASYDGKFYQFEDVYFEPKPFNGNPKIWFGGVALTEKLIKRIVEYGNGLMPGFFPTRQDLDPLAKAMNAAGRDINELELTGWLVPDFPDKDSLGDFDRTLAEQLPGMQETGYTHIAVKPSCFIDSAKDMEKFCKNAVKKLEEYST